MSTETHHKRMGENGKNYIVIKQHKFDKGPVDRDMRDMREINFAVRRNQNHSWILAHYQQENGKNEKH